MLVAVWRISKGVHAVFLENSVWIRECVGVWWVGESCADFKLNIDSVSGSGSGWVWWVGESCAEFRLNIGSVSGSGSVCAVSYTHLTLPTRSLV